MNLTKLLLSASLAVALTSTVLANPENSVNIIPMPASVTVGEGRFVVNGNVQVVYDSAFQPAAKALKDGLKNRHGISATTIQAKGSATPKRFITLQKTGSMAAEEYAITINRNGILCSATTDAGMFYAVQSLLQLFDRTGKGISAPYVEIADKPLYGWRGFMLDEARHFHGKETVKQYLDIMAGLKMNRFHWHLTDMEGWRIEIKKYPLLTTIGAVGNLSDPQATATYYTQNDVREIVAYAAERHITIVPEIDMPGHATAATRAYPEVSGGGEGRWAGFTFNPAKEETYEFISDVMAEVVELFPGNYIHVGADEVHYGNQSWSVDPEIQRFIRYNYLMSPIGLEHYFVRRVCQIVNDKGRTMIGWDEIVNTGVTPDKAIVMWWRQERPGALTDALSKGFDVILNPRLPAYLDFLQDESHKTGRRWTRREINTLEKVYQFPEMYADLIGKHGNQVLGVQSVLFAETIGNKARLDFMVFPRLLAMAENGWTKTENKDFDGFKDRVKVFLKYLDSLGIGYYNPFDGSSTPELPGPVKKSDNPIANG